MFAYRPAQQLALRRTRVRQQYNQGTTFEVLNNMHRIVAWDIETCPQPLDGLSEAQQTRYNMELAYKLDRNPDMEKEDASRLVRSVHPFLGWICCISAVNGTVEAGPNEPVSWTAATMGDEAHLLTTFWKAVARFPRNTLWVTFNGKKFDVPYIEARSAAHGIRPSRSDIRNTYPYSHRPHADLAWLWPQYYSLEGICGLLGVPSPKQEGTDGSQVARLVKDGKIDAVAAYARRDALATWACSHNALPLVSE
jgi:hypothetical protein